MAGNILGPVYTILTSQHITKQSYHDKHMHFLQQALSLQKFVKQITVVLCSTQNGINNGRK